MGAYAQYNLEFHECVYGCCGNRYLRSQMLYIRKRTNPYRKQQAELTMEWAGQAWDEHQLLFEALVDRNAEGARQAADGHIKARSTSFTEIARSERRAEGNAVGLTCKYGGSSTT